jgi:hypothetical protein
LVSLTLRVAVSPHVNSIVILLLCAMPPNDEDGYVEKMFEKSVELCGDLIKKLLAEASN